MYLHSNASRPLHVFKELIFLQALMYPLLVACKSISNLRKAAAEEVVNKVRQHSGVLVDQVI